MEWAIVNKDERQRLIEEIIDKNKINNQEEIVEALAEQGLVVTQATVSRDVKEMQLVKVPSADGGSQYSLPTDPDEQAFRQIKNIISESFVSIDIQRDMLYIKTIPGSAGVLSDAISQQRLEKIFAAISNDDSVLVICKTEEFAKEMRRRIINLI